MPGPTLLPFAAGEGGIPGQIKQEMEDFCVIEHPAYLPRGTGEHLFVRFEKRGLTTPQAVRRLASALGTDPRAAGWAGMKDRRAVTVQWASFHGGDAARARDLQLDGVRVLDVAWHPHKLRTGHLRANEFDLRLRGIPHPRLDELRQRLARIRDVGAPNYYDRQRFGAGGRNLDHAWTWLVEGGRAPRTRFDRRMLPSVLQSWIFNHVVAERVRRGLLAHPLAGDVMRREDSGGLFVAEHADEVAPRVAAWEISPTAPMPGPRMRQPAHAARALEEAVLDRLGVSPDRFARLGRVARGTRRAVRVPLHGCRLVPDPSDTVRVQLELPPGAYATAVVRELLGREPEEVEA